MDAVQADRAEIFQQRLDGKKADGNRCLLQVPDANEAMGPVLDADAPPDVGKVCGEVQARLEQVAHPGRPLRQHLVGVPVGPLHDPADRLDVVVRHVLVKQVAH
jgi:hypothetical protein